MLNFEIWYSDLTHEMQAEFKRFALNCVDADTLEKLILDTPISVLDEETFEAFLEAWREESDVE